MNMESLKTDVAEPITPEVKESTILRSEEVDATFDTQSDDQEKLEKIVEELVAIYKAKKDLGLELSELEHDKLKIIIDGVKNGVICSDRTLQMLQDTGLYFGNMETKISPEVHQSLIEDLEELLSTADRFSDDLFRREENNITRIVDGGYVRVCLKGVQEIYYSISNTDEGFKITDFIEGLKKIRRGVSGIFEDRLDFKGDDMDLLLSTMQNFERFNDSIRAFSNHLQDLQGTELIGEVSSTLSVLDNKLKQFTIYYNNVVGYYER